MKTTILLVTALFIFSLSNGQMDPLGTFNRYVAENWTAQYHRIGPYKVKGSPYLFGQSFEGKMGFEGGQFTTKERILYNLYDQKVGPDVNGEIFESEKKVEEFIINLPEKYGGNSLLFKHCNFYGEDNQKVYFNVLTDGARFGFLKIYRIRLGPDPTNMMDKDAKLFEQYFEYYLYRHGNPGELVKVKLRKKDIEGELLSVKGSDKVILNSTTNYGSETEIIRLVKAINEAN